MNKISIHKMGQAIGSYVAKKITRSDQTELLAYGAEILLGSIVKLSILFCTAAMMDIVPEITVFLVVTGLSRILSGGAHCSAYYRCLVTSILIFTSLVYSIKAVYPVIKLLPTAILLGINVLSTYLYWCYAPQAPSNKPFKSGKMKAAFRWYTLITVAILSVISIILRAENLIAWVIAFALLWQAFTLTPAGHRFIGLWDNLLTLKKKGGEAEC